MDELIIEVAENGFVIYEGRSNITGKAGKTWAFESPASLGDFIEKWGLEKEHSKKTTIGVKTMLDEISK